jgi:predicted aldo/keto reductase-like oxidoreductase
LVQRIADLGHGLPPVCRLGLATRGNTHLRAEDVEHAVERGVNYLNWCGKPDGMSRAVAGLGTGRRQVAVAVQFQARTARAAEKEFSRILKELRSDHLDIATLYYVESDEEWRQITAPGGVWDVLQRFQRQRALRMIGLTSHQRKLAAAWARQVAGSAAAGQRAAGRVAPGNDAGGQDAVSTPPQGAPDRPETGPDRVRRYRLDMLMVRYNLAHRGAEREVFPVAAARRMPVVTFTGLRWRALIEPTPHDPEGFRPPPASECYRFCLSNPAVSVALMAPDNRRQLDENLRLLDDWRAPEPREAEQLMAHGERVHQHASEFW